MACWICIAIFSSSNTVAAILSPSHAASHVLASPWDLQHFNGRCVAFGRVIEGDKVIKEIEKVYTFRGTPARDIVIENCGILGEDKRASALSSMSVCVYICVYMCMGVCVCVLHRAQSCCRVCCTDYAGVELTEQPVSRVAVKKPTHHLPLHRTSSTPSSSAQQQQEEEQQQHLEEQQQEENSQAQASSSS